MSDTATLIKPSAQGKNPHQKGGKLTGGALTREALDSSKKVLATNRGGSTIGLQSYFTPLDVATFIKQVVNPYSSVAVFDPTAGDGSLLVPYKQSMRFGCEVDGEQIENAQGDCFAEDFDPAKTNEYTSVQGDIQRLFPLLRMSEARFTNIVANPPFGLTWNEAHNRPSPIINGGKPCSSTRWTWEACTKLLRSMGSGAFITGTRRLDDEILSQPNDSKWVYAVVDIPDMFPGVELPCSIAFFADPAAMKYGANVRILRLSAHRDGFTPETWALLAKDIVNHRRDFYTYLAGYDTTTTQGFAQAFKEIQQEHTRRLKQEQGAKTAVYDVEVGTQTRQKAQSPTGKTYGKNGDRENKKWGHERTWNKRKKAWELLPRTDNAKRDSLRVILNPLAEVGIRKEVGSDALKSIKSLNGQRVNYFALNVKDWNRLKDLESRGFITMAPGAKAKIESVIQKSLAEMCPIYEIEPTQRIGYVADVDQLLCIQTDEERGFYEGESYKLTAQSQVRTSYRTETRIKKDGEREDLTFQTDRKVLEIIVDANAEGENNYKKRHAFNEDTDDIQYLLSHFDIPNPGDISTKFPAEIESRRQAIREIEADTFAPRGIKLEDYQREDAARFLFKQGGLAAWEVGLGKTLLGMLFAEACYRRGDTDGSALFCIEQDLIPQWQDEAQKFFGRSLILVDTPAKAQEVKRGIEAQHKAIAAHNREEHRRRRADKQYPMNIKRMEPQWYVTYYEAITRNGLQKSKAFQLDRVIDGRFITEPASVTTFGVRDGFAYTDKAPLKLKGVKGVYAMPPMRAKYKVSQIVTGGKWSYRDECYIPEATATVRQSVTTEEVCPVCLTDTGSAWDGMQCQRIHHQTRIPMNGCGYQHKRLHVKPMAHVLTTAFKRGCIVIDELTKIQGDESLTSEGIRALRSRRILGMSGTPIKGYVHQIYHLLGRVVGYNTPRFPFPYYGGREKFIADYCVVEKVVGTGRRKILAEPTNLMSLWRMIPGIEIRRRKENTGVEIVPKTFVPVTVPLGKTQREHMLYWLDKDNFAQWYCEKHPEADPSIVKMKSAILGMYAKLNHVATKPTGDRDADYWGINPSDWTPKILKTLEIAAEHASKGEKVLIGSDCKSVGKFLAEQLRKKGIKASHITDGEGENLQTLSPKKRAGIVKDFKGGNTSVLCAGIESMKRGHNLDTCSVAIICGLPWDSEALEQFMGRVHRKTSRKPVTLYVVLAKGSMDETKWTLVSNKAAGAELVLDGHLIEKQEKAVSQQQVINDLIKKGIPAQATKGEDGQVMEEASIEAAWEAMTFDAPDYSNDVITAQSQTVESNQSIVVCYANKSGTISTSIPAGPVKVKQEGNGYTLEFVTSGGKRFEFEQRKVKPSMMSHKQETVCDGLFAF